MAYRPPQFGHSDALLTEVQRFELEMASLTGEAPKKPVTQTISAKPQAPQPKPKVPEADKPFPMPEPVYELPPAPVLAQAGMMQSQSFQHTTPVPTQAPEPNRPAGNSKSNGNMKNKKVLRNAGGETWEDNSMADWPDDDFRIFVGDLGNECNDDLLAHAFAKYPSFQKAKVLRDKRTGKTRGFGFVSFKDPFDFSRALQEMHGKYIGNRPVKLKKSSWKDRQLVLGKGEKPKLKKPGRVKPYIPKELRPPKEGDDYDAGGHGGKGAYGGGKGGGGRW